MKCYFCNTELKWNKENTHGNASDGICNKVVNLSCPNCKAEFTGKKVESKSFADMIRGK